MPISWFRSTGSVASTTWYKMRCDMSSYTLSGECWLLTQSHIKLKPCLYHDPHNSQQPLATKKSCKGPARPGQPRGNCHEGRVAGDGAGKSFILMSGHYTDIGGSLDPSKFSVIWGWKGESDRCPETPNNKMQIYWDPETLDFWWGQGLTMEGSNCRPDAAGSIQTWAAGS